MNFFSPRDKSTALGMYSTGYFITLSVVILIVIILLILTRKMKHQNVKKTIFYIGIILIITELIKMIFTFKTYGFKELDIIPLYYCSLFMFASMFVMSKNEKIESVGKSFVFYGGISGAIAFFMYPNACIPNYPLLHFMTLRTFFYHGSMLYLGLLTGITGFVKPKLSDFKGYIIFCLFVLVLAYIFNIILDKNFMYIAKPLKFGIVQKIYHKIPHIYPILAGIIQVIVPFFIGYFGYTLVSKIKKRIKHEN